MSTCFFQQVKNYTLRDILELDASKQLGRAKHMEAPIMPAEESETATPEGQALDPSQGYCIKLMVSPDGYRVSDAEPMSNEGVEEEYAGDTYPDLLTALKHITAEVKKHPLGDDSHAQFAAGYAEGPGATAE
jgi:hypothetical protein